MDYENEVAPYKKKSTKKAPPKSKHKHDFKPCVFEYDSVRLDKAHGFVPKPDLMLGSYCPICGKIGSADGFWRQWVPVKPGSAAGRSEYTEDALKELNPETRTLPTFRLDDWIGQKFVSFEEVK